MANVRALLVVLSATGLPGCDPADKRTTPDTKPEGPTAKAERQSGGKAEPAEDGAPSRSAESIVLQRIRWSSSNPSLGPHDRTSSATVQASDFENAAAWQTAVTQLLDETRVNGRATLRTYLVAKRDKNAVSLAAIDAAGPKRLSEGGGYASLTFTTEDDVSIRIPNLKATRLTGAWDRFWETHFEGKVSEEAPVKPAP